MKRTTTATVEREAPANTNATPSTLATQPPTRADRAHERVVQVFAARIRAAFAFTATEAHALVQDSDGAPSDGTMLHDAYVRWGYDPRTPEAIRETAGWWADHVENIVSLYEIPPRIRGAVAARLAEQWPWTNPPPWMEQAELRWTGDEASYRRAMWRCDGHTELMVAEGRMVRAGIIPERVMWPTNVSFDDVTAVLARAKHPEARTMSDACRAGRWWIAAGGERTGLGALRPGVWAPQPEEYEPDPDPERAQHGGYRIADRALAAAMHGPFHPFVASLVSWAEKTHASAHATAAPFVYPSTKVSRAATANLSTRAAGGAWDVSEIAGRTGFLRVAWEGRLMSVQLSLSLDGSQDLNAEVLGALVNELSDDGLLDWLVLHMMADAQGRTGAVRWTWEEHKRLAGYGHRVSEGHRCVDEHGDAGERGLTVRATDELLRRRTIRRLWQLSRAALWEEGPDGVRARKPLVDKFVRIKAIGDAEGLDGAQDFTHAVVQVHPLLYRGAHRDAGRDAHFTSVPQGVTELRGPARRLLVFVCLAERHARDAGMQLSLPEHQVMQLAGVRGSGRPSRRDITRARAETARYLDDVRDTMGDGAAWSVRETSTGRMYDWTPARWRVEREVLGVLPARALPPPPDVPTTGAGLRAWREARNLSQGRAAELLGVGVATVKRAELAAVDGSTEPGSAPLPRSFIGRNWSVGRAPRALGDGAAVTRRGGQ